MNPDDVLAALDPEQRAVATSLSGPVCVLAGAGTGKTRAITHRIAYASLSGQHKPQHVLAVTFTTRAAGEMRQRLRRLGVGGVQARTFHSAALRQVQYFWPKVVGGAAPRIVETKVPLLAEAASRLRLRMDRTEIRDLAAEIEWAKVMEIGADDYPVAAAKAHRLPPAGRDAAAVGRLYAAYEEVKTRRNVIDFEDVLLLAVGILDERPEVASQVRGQYRHFVVDEFQDVSPLQHRLLALWLGDRSSLCVVGDPSQTIYSFAGATPAYLLDFPRTYADATVVRLVRDYRSTPQVVAVANDLLRPAPGAAGRLRVELVAQRSAGPRPGFEEHEDEIAEAAATAKKIAALIAAGVPPSEIAVLFRTNAQSEAYEQALAEAAIPYVVRGGERFFERREVREALMLLRGAARASGAGETGGLVDSVRTILGTSGWRPVAPAATGATRERWESLAAIVQLAADLAGQRPTATLDDFVAELGARAATQHAPIADGVTLASLHAAKGLEWDAVFIVGLVEGLLPISYAQTTAAIEEERRLLYVGVTRAREQLMLSSAMARSPGSRGGRVPSRFLDHLRLGVDRPLVAGGAAGRPRKPRTLPNCRTCGKPLHDAAERKIGRCAACPARYDEALYEQLRAWRSEQAAEQKVPAYVVFTDATLVAIAEARPSSTRELARIPGVGAVKLERYGEAILKIGATYSVATAEISLRESSGWP